MSADCLPTRRSKRSKDRPPKIQRAAGAQMVVSESRSAIMPQRSPSKSVSLAITPSDPDSPEKRSLRDFWKQTFGRFEGEAKEREGDEEKRKSLREEEEKSVPPKKIAGIGDDSYWTGNRVGRALYVLKNDASIRISVGGPDNEETKIDKSKALVQKALEHL